MTRSKYSKARLLRRLRAFAILYAMLCALMFLYQRDMLYVPYDGPLEPMKAGLYGFERKSFFAADGAMIPYWEYPSTTSPVTVLYLHGNGGGLHAFVPFLEHFLKANVRVVAMEYRGYPGAPPFPSERKIVGDALTLFDKLKSTSTQPVVVWGFSLGSGVAMQVAALRKPYAVVLEAPFISAASRAQQMFPIFPAKLLMHDQYRSDMAIEKVTAPLMIIHGGKDFIVPDAHGRKLTELSHGRANFKFYPEADHYDLAENGAYTDVFTWLMPNR